MLKWVGDWVCLPESAWFLRSWVGWQVTLLGWFEFSQISPTWELWEVCSLGRCCFCVGPGGTNKRKSLPSILSPIYSWNMSICFLYSACGHSETPVFL